MDAPARPRTVAASQSAAGRRDPGSGARTRAMPNAEVRDIETAPISRWEAPRIEVISLSCEITAYAPDGDEPLF